MPFGVVGCAGIRPHVCRLEGAACALVQYTTSCLAVAFIVHYHALSNHLPTFVPELPLHVQVSSLNAILSTVIGCHFGHVLVLLTGHSERLYHMVMISMLQLVLGLSLHFTDWVPMNTDLYSISCVIASRFHVITFRVSSLHSNPPIGILLHLLPLLEASTHANSRMSLVCHGGKD